MRDMGRIKEKIELRLDTRQVVSLVVGAAVVLGVVFYLGVSVGKDLGRSPLAAVAPRDPLQRLDDAAKSVDEKLTFADSLTEAERPVVAAAAGQPAPREPAVAPPVPTAPQSPPVTASAAAVVEPVAPSAPAAAVRGVPDAAELLAAADARAPAAVAPTTPVPPSPAETRTDAGGAPAREPTPPRDGFTVQAGSMPTRAEADTFADKLRKKGFSPYVITAEIPGKGTFYRVRVGHFGARDGADRYLADFKRETGLSGFVTIVGK